MTEEQRKRMNYDEAMVELVSEMAAIHQGIGRCVVEKLYPLSCEHCTNLRDECRSLRVALDLFREKAKAAAEDAALKERRVPDADA